MAIEEQLEPIAIVGIGCRFPGNIDTAQQFWETIQRGDDILTDIPADRFDVDGLFSKDRRKYGATFSRRGGYLDDVHAFDAEFFGIFPAEASRIDPQQRIALESSVHALEDSGTALEYAAGSQIGVFMGTFLSDHAVVQSGPDQRDTISPYLAMGISNCSIANRVSHRLDLHGPSMTVDTACSSSLVAIHLACQSIWAGESEAALAGGANVILRPESSIIMSKAGFLSPDGACKPFDISANGYVRSEGAGVVFLKPLSRAIQDRDRIYSTIRRSLLNQDGYTPEGFTVPSFKAQTDLLRSLYSKSGVDPSKVVYVEAHGPGTSVGDPIEANALGNQLGQVRTKEQPDLWIGSIKGNLGHLEGAAGVAGLIKAALVTFHKQIPAQANHQEPSTAIDFKGLRLAVPLKATSIHQEFNDKIWVGVNSFGAGGTNAHIILEESPMVDRTAKSQHKDHLYILSARSERAMASAASNLVTYLQRHQPDMEDVAHTLNSRRSRHAYNSIITADSLDNLCSRLFEIASNTPSREIVSLHTKLDSPARLAFVFSGQGGQWTTMGASLAKREAIFRDSLNDFDIIFRDLSGYSILPHIFESTMVSQLHRTENVQPAIAAIQIALAKTLMTYGVKPMAIVGHSVGEVAAAHVAGAITLNQAVKIIYMRSKIQSKAAGRGSMLAIGMSYAEMKDLIMRENLGRNIEIAAINGPKMITAAGDTKELEHLAMILNERGTFAKKVNVEVPYHTQFMDPLKDELVEAVSTVRAGTTTIDLYSSVTSALETGTHLTGEYWFDNIRKPVQYVQTVEQMLQDGYNFFVEIGPHPVLVSGTRDVANNSNIKTCVLPAMMRENEVEPMARVIGVARCLGQEPDISSFNGGQGRHIDLPLYPFQREHHQFEQPEDENRRLSKSRHPFLRESLSLTDDGRASVRLRLNTGNSPFLADHVVDGAIVFPMTAHIEVAYMAASEHMPHRKIRLENLHFEHPLVLATAENFAPQTMIEITSPAGDYAILSRKASSLPQDKWQVCSKGRINSFDRSLDRTPEAMESVRSRVQLGSEIDIEHFYETLDKSGIKYGDAFQCIQKMWRLGLEIFTSLQLPSLYSEEAAKFKLHPALFDSCIHSLFLINHAFGDPSVCYLPHHVEQVEILSNAQGITDAITHVTVKHQDDETVTADATVYNVDGQVVAFVTALTLKRLESAKLTRPVEHDVIMKLESTETRDRVQTEFTNILCIDLHLGDFDWLTPVTNAFTDAQIHHTELSILDNPWNEREWGFQLDRRSILVISATVSLDADIRPTVQQLFDALLRIASWVQRQQRGISVVILTQGGCLVEGDLHCNPISSLVQAAARVIINEQPSSRIRVVDIAMDQPLDQSALLEEELRTSRLTSHDTVVAIRSKGRYFKRMAAVDAEREMQVETQIPARGGRYVCERGQSGGLDNLIMRQCSPVKVGVDDIEIEVHASGLNFKDVMNEMGLLSDRATVGGLSGQNLGLEVAGRVTRTGKNVKGFVQGASVMARVQNGLTGLAVTNCNYVMPIPASLTFEQAACIPVVYVTAYYALVYLGRLSAGETVLIHSAAGGVGIAAIQIAKAYGARVFGTAGSPTRREWVSSLGVEAVFDSRSLSFHDEVKQATGNRGVDLVLNCLTGSMLSQSVACLAPFGRLLEIGKTDIYRNMRLGLEQFGENCSFHVVDIDRMCNQKPILHRRMMEEVCSMFETGELQPLPITSFSIQNLADGFKALSRSAVIGKVAISMPTDTDISAVPQKRLQLDENGSYIVTGGCSGLGLQLARFLSRRGARYLVLISRSGPKTPEALAIIHDLRNRGISVTIEKVDISCPEQVTQVLLDRTDRPPVRGVIHSAGILQNAFSHETTMDDFWKVFSPKAIGAWNLHRTTQDMNLDFFVMISSISSVLGLTGQISYAAANEFLDSLAHSRRALGLHGLAINLGVLGEFAGMSQKSESTTRLFDIMGSEGLHNMPLPATLSAFERLILQNSTQRVVGVMDYQAFVKAHPHLSGDGLFSELCDEEAGKVGSQTNGHAVDLRGPNGVQHIANALRVALAKIVGLDASRISMTENIDQYAFDSLMLTQIRAFILREFRVAYPLMSLFQGPSLESIGAEIQVSIGGSFSPQTDTKEAMVSHKESSLPPDLSVISPWLIRGKGSGRKVLCFHSMGAGASLYYPFLLNPPAGMQFISIQLPGRETRSEEDISTCLSDIVSSIISEMDFSFGTADIFWGHSFGGITAFEVMRALRRKGKPVPSLMITGTIAPQLAHIWQRREALLQVMVADCSPEYLLSLSRYVDADFARSILPLMKKDAPLLLDYEFQDEVPFNVPIVAVTSRQDDMVYRDEVDAWRAHTADFELIEVDGDHWFLRRNHKLLCEVLVSLGERSAIVTGESLTKV